MANSDFVHLHVHSSFSLSEGALPIDVLLSMTHSLGHPAVAVTDRDNLFGALEFSQKAISAGIQPIIGCKLRVSFDSDSSFILLFLCMDSSGYENLMHLVSKAHLEGEGIPQISFSKLSNFNEGLIVLSGGNEGPLNFYLSSHQPQRAESLLGSLKDVFSDRFYIELQRNGTFSDGIEDSLIDLAYNHEVPIVATNEVYYPTSEDYEAHDALMCIADKSVLTSADRRKLSNEHYLKTGSEMVELFSDLPEAITNTIEIARRCAFCVPTCDPMLPSFTGDDIDSEVSELRRQSMSGLSHRLQTMEPATGYTKQDYEDRLSHELSIIEKMNYSGYFLIVADFVCWAKSQNISVGPGRGSGAGSLVAWSLTITDLDPIRFSLLFERFLNPERISMPDFDIDFCQNRRDEVIRYVQSKYGESQVAQIITFGTLQARAVLRDVGRVLQMPYGQVDRLCKLVPNNPANPTTLAQAIDTEPALKQARAEEDNVDRLLTISLKLEGLYRHASTHAAGIVIGDRPLDRLVPLYRDYRSDMPVTQFNMKWVEHAGLVKFDFLGLKTLTVIRRTIDYLSLRSVSVDIDSVALDDTDTFTMLQSGETVGVFQLESGGMRKALIGMRPDCFEDIIALVALYRPGPMENIPLYNSRKHGELVADYYDDKIRKVLEETHGVIIYQEQVMEIAQILSGYTLGEADVLRRAMGKKIRKEMEQNRKRFVSGAIERGTDSKKANDIFNVLVKFADYGFNKSHAAAYAMLSYQTAWLKCHYPIEFLAALMTLDINNTDKLNDFYREGLRSGIIISPPCVNRSSVDFCVKDGVIHYALSAVKGVGSGVEHIIEVRDADGEFRSLTDFFSRVDVKQLNRKMLENLINAGAFDCFGVPREQLQGNLDVLLGHSTRIFENSRVGIEDMFGDIDSESSDIRLQPIDSITGSERLLREYESLGFYLSAHPLDEYMDRLSSCRIHSYLDFEQKVQDGYEAGKLAGIVMGLSERKTRNGSRMAVARLSDSGGQFEVVLFSQLLEQYRPLFIEGNILCVTVEADERSEGLSLRVQSARLLEDELSRVSSDSSASFSTRPSSPSSSSSSSENLRIFVRDTSALSHLSGILESGDGSGKVSVVVVKESGPEVEVDLPDNYYITPEVAGAIKSISGVIEVKLF